MYSMFALDDILITNIILNKKQGYAQTYLHLSNLIHFAVNYNVFFITIIINMVSHLIFTISNVMFFLFSN